MSYPFPKRLQCGHPSHSKAKYLPGRLPVSSGSQRLGQDWEGGDINNGRQVLSVSPCQ